MFKRKIGLILVVSILLLALVLGCSNGTEVDQEGISENGQNGGDAEELPQITAVTSPLGSGWHSVNVLLGDIWMDEIDGLFVTVQEGGSVGNIKAVDEGIDANVGWGYSSDLKEAYEGTGLFDKKHDNVKIMANMYPSTLNIVTLAKDGFESVYDLKDKNLNVGAIGSGAEVLVQRLFDVHGMSYDSIINNGGSISYGNYSDAASQLSDGIVDAMLACGAPSLAAVYEVQASHEIKLLPVSDDKLQELYDRDYGYVINRPLPANTYENQTEEIPSVGLQGYIFVNADLPEDLVYQMTKLLWEVGWDRIIKEQPSRGENMDIDKAVEDIDPENLHPGAAKYYKEIGLIN